MGHEVENCSMTARQDDAVKAAVIHQLRDKWWTPEEAATALKLPPSTVQHWWSTDAEKVTWTPAMKAQYGKYQRLIELHG
jgi:hypothetical protein